MQLAAGLCQDGRPACTFTAQDRSTYRVGNRPCSKGARPPWPPLSSLPNDAARVAPGGLPHAHRREVLVERAVEGVAPDERRRRGLALEERERGAVGQLHEVRVRGV